MELPPLVPVRQENTRTKYASTARHFGHALVYSDSTTKTRFGKTLNTIRLDLQVSQQTVAKRAGLARTLIVRFEDGSRMPTRESVDAIVNAFPEMTKVMRQSLYEAAGYIPSDQWSKH